MHQSRFYAALESVFVDRVDATLHRTYPQLYDRRIRHELMLSVRFPQRWQTVPPALRHRSGTLLYSCRYSTFAPESRTILPHLASSDTVKSLNSFTLMSGASIPMVA